jgi:hypothetical protein
MVLACEGDVGRRHREGLDKVWADMWIVGRCDSGCIRANFHHASQKLTEEKIISVDLLQPLKVNNIFCRLNLAVESYFSFVGYSKN